MEGNRRMITYDDQRDIFRLIAENITRDITCYAWGGTAMMFYGYKDETKDIDLVFTNKEQRKEFMCAIEKLGFEKTSPIKIYIPEKLKDKHVPVIYTREDSRCDLFEGQIFQTCISPKMKEDVYAIHEFKGKKTVHINVLRKEHIVLLKAITERQNDFDDIRTLLRQEKRFEW